MRFFPMQPTLIRCALKAAMDESVMFDYKEQAAKLSSQNLIFETVDPLPRDHAQ